MVQETNISSSKGIWRKSGQTLKAVVPQAVYISFLCIILPHILFEWHLAEIAQQTSNQLSEIIGFFKSDNPEVNSINFKMILQTTILFALKLFGVGLSIALINLVGYFAILRLCDQFHRGQPLMSLSSNLKSAVFTTIKGGFLGLVFLVFLVVIAQTPVIAPLVIILLPGVMFPVLLGAEKQGLMSAIRKTSSLAYTRPLPGEKWAMFFQIISMGALFYIAIVMLSFISKFLLNLDTYLGMGRSLWITPLAASPFSGMYLLTAFIEICLMTLVICMIAATTTTLYYWPKILDSQLPNDGIEA